MDKGVSKLQFALLAMLMPMVFKLTTLPSLLAGAMQRDSWIGILFALILEFIQLFIILEVQKNGGMSALKIKIGNVWYALLTVPLLVVFGIKTMVFAAEAVDYVSNVLFYNVKSINVVVMLFIAIVFVAARGSVAIGRLSEIALWLLPITLLVGLAFGKLNLNFSYVLPIMADGANPIVQGMDKYLLWTFDFTPLLFINITKQKSKVPLILIGSLISIAAVTGIYTVFIATYGGSAHLIKYAFAMMAAFNVVSTEIGSLDWPSIMIWVVMAVLTLATKIHASATVLETFKIKRQVGCLIVGGILCVITVIFFYNYEKVLTFATSWVRYLVIGIDVIAPIIYLIALKIKKKSAVEALNYEKVG